MREILGLYVFHPPQTMCLQHEPQTLPTLTAQCRPPAHIQQLATRTCFRARPSLKPQYSSLSIIPSGLHCDTLHCCWRLRCSHSNGLSISYFRVVGMALYLLCSYLAIIY